MYRILAGTSDVSARCRPILGPAISPFTTRMSPFLPWYFDCSALSHTRSIKIVGVEIDIDAAHAVDLFGANGGDAVLALQHAVDDQERLLDDNETIAREQIGPDDDVRNPRLIFEGEKDEAFRRPGPLACDHHAGDADATALPRGGQIARAQDAAHRQILAAQRHRMAAGGESHARLVRYEALGLRHRLQGTEVGTGGWGLGAGIERRAR